jgi:hypothetical protein
MDDVHMDDNWPEDRLPLPHSKENGGSEEDGGSAGNPLPDKKTHGGCAGSEEDSQQPVSKSLCMLLC